MTAFSPDAPGTPAETWSTDPRRAGVPDAVLAVRGGQPARRLVVVAAHPDDETLGAGGLLTCAHEAGLCIEVVVLTAGEASHPGSPTHSPSQLARRRREEVVEAVTTLAPSASLQLADHEDGELEHCHDHVVARLVEVIGDGRRALLVAPWCRDGHPDHEAAGRAARVAALRTDATLWEYPVWFWHWGHPDDAPWSDLTVLRLREDRRRLKRRAMAAHRTQVAPLSQQPGDETLLTDSLLAHFTGDGELFVRDADERARPVDRALDEIHHAGAEPWGADQRWYEQRKRRLLLACLPAPRYERVLEVGCSTGTLASDLADRCAELVGVDASPEALRTAARRLEPLANVRLERHDVPWSWPSGTFDLIVLSEVGYFLSPAALDRLLERVRDGLTGNGTVVLCHWRHRVVGWPLDGPDVHARFREADLPPELARYADRDAEIVVLAPPAQSPDPSS